MGEGDQFCESEERKEVEGVWCLDACACHCWQDLTASDVVRVVVGGASWGAGVLKCGLRSILVMASLIQDVRVGRVVGAILQAWVKRVRVPCSTVLSSLRVVIRVGYWHVVCVWYNVLREWGLG